MSAELKIDTSAMLYSEKRKLWIIWKTAEDMTTAVEQQQLKNRIHLSGEAL